MYSLGHIHFYLNRIHGLCGFLRTLPSYSETHLKPFESTMNDRMQSWVIRTNLSLILKNDPIKNLDKL